MNIDNLFTVAEAADHIGVTPGRIRQMLRAEEIDGILANGRCWLIPKDEAERVRRERPSTGRPRSNPQ